MNNRNTYNSFSETLHTANKRDPHPSRLRLEAVAQTQRARPANIDVGTGSGMGYFDTKKGRVLVGLSIFSGGGMLITQVAQKVTDPTWQQALQALLVFWVIFAARLTYSLGWQYPEGESAARTAGVPVSVKAPAKGGAAASKGAAVQIKGSGSDDDSEGEAAGKPRRRRARRD